MYKKFFNQNNKSIEEARIVVPSFRIGETVQLTDLAIEEYGEEFSDFYFTIENVYTSEYEHPDFDEWEAMGDAMYDLEGFDFPVYGSEIEDVPEIEDSLPVDNVNILTDRMDLNPYDV